MEPNTKAIIAFTVICVMLLSALAGAFLNNTGNVQQSVNNTVENKCTNVTLINGTRYSCYVLREEFVERHNMTRWLITDAVLTWNEQVMTVPSFKYANDSVGTLCTENLTIIYKGCLEDVSDINYETGEIIYVEENKPKHF